MNNQDVLEQAKLAADENVSVSGYRRNLHHIAEEHYEPAIEVFEKWLTHFEPDWREMAVSLLGFHYDLSQRQNIIRRIENMVETDESTEVRIGAAFVLATQTDWPNSALINALQSEMDFDVKIAIFDALIGQKGLPPIKTTPEIAEIIAGRKKPDFENLERITGETFGNYRN